MEYQQKPVLGVNHQEDPVPQQTASTYYRDTSEGSVPTVAPEKEEAVNTSCNHNGTSCIFDVPECVIDVYLEAINGGGSRDERFRSLSERYGQAELEEKSNFNCNHNVQEVPPGYCGGCHPDKCYDRARDLNPEPRPNEGCGCSFSYNGGAGAGTADCGCDAYDNGFTDKKRDHSCPCSSPEARRSHVMGHSHSGGECPYQRELCNKKAVSSCCTGLSEVEYKPEVVNNKPVLPSCCCEGGPYEKDLVNKKPSICSPCGPEFHNTCEPKTLHCHQSEYRTRPKDIPDRRCFYSDEECGNTQVIKRCNNNSCNIDLVYDLDGVDDPCAVGVPCLAEASYFHSNQMGVRTTAFFPQQVQTKPTSDSEEEEEPEIESSEKASVSPMYTTVALESDEAADHLLPELTGGKRWQVQPLKGSQTTRSYVESVANNNKREEGKGCILS